MGLFGNQLVERRLVNSLNDIPDIRPDEMMKIITFIPDKDELVSDFDPEVDSTARLRNLVNAHLRLDPVPRPKPPPQPNPPVLQPNLPLLQPNLPLLQPNPPVLQPNFPPLQPNLPPLQPNLPPLQPNLPLLQPNPPLMQPNPFLMQPSPPLLQPNPPVMQLNPPILPPQPLYTKILEPSHQDLLVAATHFDNVADYCNIEYAIIGGFAAVLYGGRRQTQSLDILLKPGNLTVIQQIQFLFHSFHHVFKISLPDDKGRQHRIVVTSGTTGVPINFFDSQNNNIDLPDLLPLTTYADHPTMELPVLLPRYLLSQRIYHFGRDQALVNDFQDIFVFLAAMQIRREVFVHEGPLLLPGIGDVLRFGVQLGFAPVPQQWQAVGIPNPLQIVGGVQKRQHLLFGVYKSNQPL